MILIVGGMSSGKKTYAISELGYNDEDISDGVVNDKPVVYNLQEVVKSQDADNSDSLIDTLLTKEVVICNEMGAGIIPAASEDRKWRENTGRLCVLLAKEATQVIRMTCGIPNIIKRKR